MTEIRRFWVSFAAVAIGAVAMILVISLGLTTGCAQSTTAPVGQPTSQVQSPLSDQAAQGSKSDVRLYIINAPGGNELPEDSFSGVINLGVADGQDDALTHVGETSSSESGNNTKDTRAGFVQSGITVNIHTGGSSTGEQSTGGLSGQTSTPGATITQSPTQEPQASTQVPIAVGMPGSAPQASGTGAVQGSASQTADQQNQLRTALIRAASGDTSMIAEVFRLLFDEDLPAAVPDSQPAGGS